MNCNFKKVRTFGLGALATMLLITPVQATSSTETTQTETTQVDWSGIKRDMAYFMGYQTVVIAVLYVSSENISNWSEESKENWGFHEWRENVRKIVWDKDDHSVNYIGHPYFGAAYYVMGRGRGLSHNQAFAYSALLSAMYEFGFEAAFENPSIQDLIVTPVAGTWVGTYFLKIQERLTQKRQSQKLTFSEKLTLAFVDPMGGLNRTFDRWFGFKPNSYLSIRDQRLTFNFVVNW